MKVKYSIDVSKENIVLSFSELSPKEYASLLALLETMKASDYDMEETSTTNIILDAEGT